MTELLLIRHGQTDWNREQKVMGCQAIPLNATGRAQAARLNNFLRHIDIHAMYASPVKRAWETAEIIWESRSVKLHVAHELAEINYGEWVNMSFADIHRDRNEAWRTYKTNPEALCIPGGESMAEVKARVGSFVDSILNRHQRERIAFVSHADVLKIVLVHIFQFPLYFLRQCSIHNGGLVWVRYDEEFGPRLNFYNGLNKFGEDL